MANDSKSDITAGQCRAARGLLGWTQEDLERESGVGRKTIADFERDKRTPQARTLRDFREAFERAGMEFIAENGGGAGVRWRERFASADRDNPT